MITRQLVRRFTTSAVRKSGHDDRDGIPGTNIPFPVGNKHVTTLIFCVYFGSGFSLPYLTLRHMMLK